MPIQKIPISEIEPSPYQPRHDFPAAELAELGASIKANGLLQAILVRPIKGKAPYKYQLVDGQRRFEAHKAIHWQDIEANVRPMSDLDAVLFAGIANIQREELTGYDEYQWLLNVAKLYESEHKKKPTKVQLSKLTSKGYNWIDNRLSVADYRPDVLDVVKRKKHVISAAALINKIPDPEQRKVLLDMVEKDASFVQVKSRIDEMARDKAIKASARRAPDTHTQQRIATANASGSAPVSRGKQVKGASASQSVTEAVNGLKTASVQIDNAATWFRTIDAKSYEAKVVPEIKKLIAKLEVFVR